VNGQEKIINFLYILVFLKKLLLAKTEEDYFLKENIKFFAKVLATGFYSGLSPRAPGTVGSAVYAGLAIIIASVAPECFSTSIKITTVFLVTSIALLSTEVCLRSQVFGKSGDPGQVVIDEWAGMAVTLLCCPPAVIDILICFLLFRLFDIWKPWPVKNFEKLPGSLGVTLDDIIAGLFALLSYWIFWVFIPGASIS